MYLGALVEVGPAECVFAPPFHPTPRRCLPPCPRSIRRAHAIRAGQYASAVHARGCPFHTRCPRSLGAQCRRKSHPGSRWAARCARAPLPLSHPARRVAGCAAPGPLAHHCVGGMRMIEHADAVVIGSGALGASTAFHLAQGADWRMSPCSTSTRSARRPRPARPGSAQQVRDFELMTRILPRRAVEKMLPLRSRTPARRWCIHQSGSPENRAHARARAASFATEVARGHASRHRYRSRDTRRRRGGVMPFFEAGGRRGDLLQSRDDLYLEPDQIRARLRARLRRGSEGKLMPDTRVEAHHWSASSGVRGVLTGRGESAPPVVVDAGGAWLRQIGETAGAAGGRSRLCGTSSSSPSRSRALDPAQPIARVIDC